MGVLKPGSVQDLLDMVSSFNGKKLGIRGSSSKSVLSGPMGDGSDVLDMSEVRGLVSFEPDDQTVTVLCGTQVADLQEELAKRSQCLPLPRTGHALVDGFPGTVGGLLAMNLPHGLEAVYGSPRDWLLHLEILAFGGLAASGAKVVKSVAGYDVHKAVAGSRGHFGPFVTATFRTWPLKRLAEHRSNVLREWSGGPVWIARTLASEFQGYLEQTQGVLAYDKASCTLWADMEPKRPDEGWIMGPGGAVWPDTSGDPLVTSMKSVFDPSGMWL